MNFLKYIGDNSRVAIPYKRKEETEETKPKYDPTAPYGGIVDSVFKPKYDEAEEERQQKIMRTQAIGDALKLAVEGFTGAIGGDIAKRGPNREIERSRSKIESLKKKFQDDQTRYNIAKMQEKIRNIQHNVRKAEKEEDREYANKTWSDRYKTQRDDSIEDWNRNKDFQREMKQANEDFQKEMLNARTDAQKELAQENFNRKIWLAKNGYTGSNSSKKPYLEIMGEDGYPAEMSQGMYNYILAKVIEDPNAAGIIDKLNTASDSYSKNRLNVIVQQYAKKFFDIRDGKFYPKTQSENSTKPKNQNLW